MNQYLKIRSKYTVTRIAFLFITLLIAGAYSCGLDSRSKYANSIVYPGIIPKPMELISDKGVFFIDKRTTVSISGQENEVKTVAEFFVGNLNICTGLNVELDSKAGNIKLVLDKSLNNLGEEGYTLNISPLEIVVEAYEPAGLFYGTQTILQLLFGTKHEVETLAKNEWIIPCVRIKDQPRFSWRGYMKDVSRTFYSVDVVKKYLDVMALYKMNVFHFHLTDDQGWRMEVKAFPELTSEKTTIFPDRFNEPIERSGFYTQEQLKEIVEYAAERNITVVPEIDIPGHCWPIVISYPELSVNKGTDPPYVFPFLASWEIWGNQRTPNTLDPTNEAVYEFLNTLFDEVTEIFPSKYIHFGGDEVKFSVWDAEPHIQEFIKDNDLRSNKDLQSYFVARVCEIIRSKGRQPIGWNDILEGDHEPIRGAAVMSWLGDHAIHEAVKNGFQTVATPTGYTYLDITQADRNDGTMSDLAYRNINSLERIYHYEPTTGLDSLNETYVLGIQANMWTAIPQEVKDMNVQNFPRLLAVAEIGWVEKGNRDFDDFQTRLDLHYPILDQLKVDSYRDGGYIAGKWTPEQVSPEYDWIEWDVTTKVYANGRINAAFFYTSGNHFLEIEMVELLENGKAISADKHYGIADEFRGTHKTKTYFYRLNIDSYDAMAEYTLRAKVKGKGGNDSYGNFTFNLSPYKPFMVIEPR